MSESIPSDIPLLEMRGIDKRFPGVHALADVSLTLQQGEVLALLGIDRVLDGGEHPAVRHHPLPQQGLPAAQKPPAQSAKAIS